VTGLATRNDVRLAWLSTLRLYLGFIFAGNLLWETLHLPLYTLGLTGSVGEKTFAVLHCTGGDVLIALATLALALVVAGDEQWPERSFIRVAAIAIPLGIAYTAFSEWRNVYVQNSWSYASSMPVISVMGFKIGLSPLFQWLVVPLTAFYLARQITLRKRGQRS